MKTNEITTPHGDKLINCFSENPKDLMNEAKEFTFITVTKRVLCDIEMFAIGAFSPLNGFTGKKDYESILENMRLANGLIWPGKTRSWHRHLRAAAKCLPRIHNTG